MKGNTLLWISVAVLMAAVLIGGYFYFQNLKIEEEQITAKSYNFLLADTQEKRVQGLSGKDFLPSDTIMFFDFEKEDDCVIWMKDMKFSIDAIWLDSEFKVIDFQRGILVSSYPFDTYAPFSRKFPFEVFLCRYLIETNEGFIKENAVQIGDNVLVDFTNSTLKVIKSLQ